MSSSEARWINVLLFYIFDMDDIDGDPISDSAARNAAECLARGRASDLKAESRRSKWRDAGRRKVGDTPLLYLARPGGGTRLIRVSPVPGPDLASSCRPTERFSRL